MDLKVYQKSHLAVEWTVQTPVFRSSSFVTFNTICHLSFFSGIRIVSYSRADSVNELRFHMQCQTPTPLNITAYLLRRTDLICPQATTIRGTGDHVIWNSTASSELLPNTFEAGHSHTFLVAIYSSSQVFSEDKCFQTPTYADDVFGILSLSEDLSKMLDDVTLNSDVELVCGGRTFNAHRNVLSVRSNVFRAMLGNDMSESKTGKVEIEDADADIFEQFLHYLYKGTLEILSMDTAMELYKLGDKYAVETLRVQCASFLEENMALDNACSILSLAYHHSDADLEELATSFVVDQRIPLQYDKSDWSSFRVEHPHLAVDVMTRLCEQMASSK